MPHQCTDCEETYADGSQSILSGCESCGGTTFQYVPTIDSDSGEQPQTEDATDDSSEADENSPLGGGLISVGSDSDSASDDTISPEDSSQHSARTDVVDSDELSYSAENTDDPIPEQSPDVDLDTLRQELNKQFEGIHIIEPGHYELNLMELYRREECIITLHEDGRYAIGVPGDGQFSLDSDDV